MSDILQKDNLLNEKPEMQEISELKQKFNTDFLWVIYGRYGFVRDVVRVLKWEKQNPWALVDALKDTRSQIVNMWILQQEAANDEKYLKNGTL